MLEIRRYFDNSFNKFTLHLVLHVFIKNAVE